MNVKNEGEAELFSQKSRKMQSSHYVRTSLAAVPALRLRRGTFHKKAKPTGLNLLLYYEVAMFHLFTMAFFIVMASCSGEMYCESVEAGGLCSLPDGVAGDGVGGIETVTDSPAEQNELTMSEDALGETLPDNATDQVEVDGLDAILEDESPQPPAVYSFVVFGDSQFATTSCTSGVPERLAIPQAILNLSPTFILHTGDLMDHGYEDGAYEAFVGCYEEMLAAIPFFPTAGNHDMGSGGIWNYKAYLETQLFVTNPLVYPGYNSDFVIAYEDDPTEYCTSPSNPCYRDIVPSGFSFKTFYAYRYSNAYFLSFEQGTRWWTNTPIPWVEDHLSAARADPGVDHIFVYMHHPMYSTTMAERAEGECIEPVRRHYEELFRRYDVTMVFSGHAHVYEHFLVPDDGSFTRSRPPPDSYPHDGDSIHYLVTGGGGGPLPNRCSPMPAEREGEPSYNYSQSRGCGYHVTMVEVEGRRVTVSIIGVEGRENDFSTSVWDTFVLE